MKGAALPSPSKRDVLRSVYLTCRQVMGDTHDGETSHTLLRFPTTKDVLRTRPETRFNGSGIVFRPKAMG